MANTRSAAKQARAALRRRTRNRSSKSAFKSIEREIRQLVGDGKHKEAAELLPKLQSQVDRAAKKKVVHANFASRHVARYNKLVAKKA